VFMVVAYSLKGLRFKEKPVLDSITSSIHFVGPLLFASALNGFPEYTWGFIGAFFIWGMASHAFGAVQDIVPDKKGGIASIATFLGARTTMWFAYILYYIAALLVFIQGNEYLSIAIVGILYCANIIPYLKVTELSSASVNTAWKRFLKLNYFAGFIITLVILAQNLL